MIAGKMMWADIVNPNWIRASSSALPLRHGRPSYFQMASVQKNGPKRA